MLMDRKTGRKQSYWTSGRIDGRIARAIFLCKVAGVDLDIRD